MLQVNTITEKPVSSFDLDLFYDMVRRFDRRIDNTLTEDEAEVVQKTFIRMADLLVERGSEFAPARFGQLIEELK